MISFAILLFFAVTGLTLNHQNWFAGQARTTQFHGSLNPQWVKTADPKDVAKLEIVEYLRRTHHIRAALRDFRIDDGQCEVAFKGPGYEADIFIDRSTAGYDLTETRAGLVAVVNDLHKGRDTGAEWSAAIDLSAILMTCVSLTGLTLLFFLQKRLVKGLIVLGAGAAVFSLAYLVWVR
jgi:hypothetical protein